MYKAVTIQYLPLRIGLIVFLFAPRPNSVIAYEIVGYYVG